MDFLVTLTSGYSFVVTKAVLFEIMQNRPSNHIVWVDAQDSFAVRHAIRADQIVSYREGGF
jgi:hypothetical protein